MEPLRIPRAEHDVLAAAPIAVVLGGRTFDLPPLVIADNREWKRKLAAVVGVEWVRFASADDYAAITAFLSGLTDPMVDLILAYDTRGVLGDREWIEAHATDAEVYAAIKEVLAVAYPPFADARTMPGLGQVLIGLIGSLSQARTSSSQPAGAPSPDASTGS